jgi:hypothetical protein
MTHHPPPGPRVTAHGVDHGWNTDDHEEGPKQPAKPHHDSTPIRSREPLLVGWTGVLCEDGWARGTEGTRPPHHHCKLLLAGWVEDHDEMTPSTRPSPTSHCSWGGSRVLASTRKTARTRMRANAEPPTTATSGCLKSGNGEEWDKNDTGQRAMGGEASNNDEPPPSITKTGDTTAGAGCEDDKQRGTAASAGGRTKGGPGEGSGGRGARNEEQPQPSL